MSVIISANNAHDAYSCTNLNYGYVHKETHRGTICIQYLRALSSSLRSLKVI